MATKNEQVRRAAQCVAGAVEDGTGAAWFRLSKYERRARAFLAGSGVRMSARLVDDAAEYFDVDVLTKKNIRQYADEIAGTTFSLPSRFTRADWRKFVEFCNKTIEDYNR